jgi:tetratricopeptide (TPR) repeat protein
MVTKRTLYTLLVAVAILSFTNDIFAQRKRREDAPAAAPSRTQIETRSVEVDSKAMEKRDEAIQQLQELIKDYPEGPRKAEIYRRLAELYWEQSRVVKGAIMEEYNKATNRYYELNDPNLPMPELDLKPAWEWNNKAIEICDYIIKKYPNFQGIDEVYFFMASNLMEVGQPLRAIRFYTLVVERFEKSRFAADSYFEMGEYFFNSNNVFKAMPNYKAVIDKFPENKFYGFALYKYAWCMYNVGEYEESVKLFQQVVIVADKIEDVSLKEDALNDMVAPYAESGTVADAERYFKTIVKETRYFIAVLRRLAEIYFEQDRSQEAITIYRKLIQEAPERPEGPTWQKQIVECYKKLNDKDKVREEIINLVKNYADPSAAWVKVNKADEVTLESARQTAETALRILTVEYHNEARKTKNEITWKIVGELYPTYLKYFPKSEASYDMRFNFAEFLYDHKKYSEAGDQYQIVADLNPKGHHFENASFGAVSCFGMLLEAEQKRAENLAKQRMAASRKEGAGEIRADRIALAEEKGEAKKEEVDDAFKPKEIPDLHQRFIRATETYIQNIPRSKYLVDIIYKQAITYYTFNHFDKAVPSFEMIVQKHPRHDLAVYAADLIMDSLNMTKDWDAINNKAREMLRNSALISGRNRLKNDLDNFKEMASFYSSEIPAQGQRYLESADRYMAFVTEFPRSKFNDIAMFNSVVYYQRGGDLYKSIRVQEQFLRENDDIYKKSKVRERVMFGLAKNYEAIAEYDRAARLYIDFVENAPTSDDAKDAIYNAAVLFEAIGDTERAIDNYRLYVDKYAKTDLEKSQLALQYGYIWMRKGRSFYDRAERGFDRFVSEHLDIRGLNDFVYIDEQGKRRAAPSKPKVIIEKGSSNVIFALYGARMRMNKEIGNNKEYYKNVDKVLQIFRDGEFKDKEDVNEISRDTVANALLEELAPEFSEFLAIRFDNIPIKPKMKGYEFLTFGFDVVDGKVIHHGGENPDDYLTPGEKRHLTEAAKVKDEFNEVSQERMTKKIELTVSLTDKYANIIELTKSPRYTPAVLYHIGRIYKDLTDQMFNAPLAPWLSEAQIAEYKNFLDEKALGAQKNAVAFFEQAMRQGYNTSVYSDWIIRAKRQLKYFPMVTGGKYYDENEIVPRPNMIETSSFIGRVDTNIKFPELDPKEREELKRSLNRPKVVEVQQAPSATEQGSVKTTEQSAE